MKYMCTLLVVENIKESLKLYKNILGLEIENDFGENISFIGGLSLHQKQHFENLINQKITTQKHNTKELYFEDDALEAHYESIKEDYDVLHGIITQPWHQRVFRFYDTDGHLIEVGESLRAVVIRLNGLGHSNFEIVEMMGIPELMVEKFLSGIPKQNHE